MKLRENRIQRDHRPRAGEVLTAPEEPEFKFNPKIHLTNRNWTRASNEMDSYRVANNPIGGLGILFFETCIDPERAQQEPANTYGQWVEDLSTTMSTAAVKEIRQERTPRQYQALLYARNLFPNQPDFAVDVNDLNNLIHTSYGGGSAVFLHALQNEYFMKQCPDQHPTDPILPECSLTSENVKKVIEGIRSNLHQRDPEMWIRIVFQMVMLRVASPESFELLNLDQAFWEKAVGMLEVMRRHVLPTFVFFKYAAYLEMLAAKQLRLDDQGNMVLDHGRNQPLAKSSPLPLRDIA